MMGFERHLDAAGDRGFPLPWVGFFENERTLA